MEVYNGGGSGDNSGGSGDNSRSDSDQNYQNSPGSSSSSQSGSSNSGGGGGVGGGGGNGGDSNSEYVLVRRDFITNFLNLQNLAQQSDFRLSLLNTRPTAGQPSSISPAGGPQITNYQSDIKNSQGLL